MLQTHPTVITDIHALPDVRRMVVLIPENEKLDEYFLGCCIHKLARIHSSDILYLSVIQNYDNESRTQMKLDDLANISRDLHNYVTSELYDGISWLKAVQAVWKPGDLVVCLDGHTIREWGFRHVAISEYLVARLGVTVYVFSNGSEI